MTDHDEVERVKNIGLFRDVVDILERNLSYLRATGLDASTARAYRKTLTFLKRRSDSEVAAILGGPRQHAPPDRRNDESSMATEQIAQLPLEEVAKLIDSAVSRALLEELAVVRFGMTPGSVSAFRSRTALIEKIKTAVNHEVTHEAISRTIASPDGPDDTCTTT